MSGMYALPLCVPINRAYRWDWFLIFGYSCLGIILIRKSFPKSVSIWHVTFPFRASVFFLMELLNWASYRMTRAQRGVEKNWQSFDKIMIRFQTLIRDMHICFSSSQSYSSQMRSFIFVLLMEIFNMQTQWGTGDVRIWCFPLIWLFWLGQLIQ